MGKKPYICTKKKFIARFCHMRCQNKIDGSFKCESKCIDRLMKEDDYKKDVLFFSKRIFCS